MGAMPGTGSGIRDFFRESRSITGAEVAEPGQRRRIQGPVSQEFRGSNPFLRIRLNQFWNPIPRIVTTARAFNDTVYGFGTHFTPIQSAVIVERHVLAKLADGDTKKGDGTAAHFSAAIPW